MSAYCAAKAGLSMLTQVAAMELASRGIRVNAVAPGFVHDPADRGRRDGARHRRGLHREHRAGPHRNSRGHRRGDAFCITKAPWLTGEVLDINGGAHMMRYPDVMGATAEADGTGVTFAGKQAIVTGAGSGIGAALCRALAGAGADVVCTDVDGDAAARTAEPLGARSARSTSPTPPPFRRRRRGRGRARAGST